MKINEESEVLNLEEALINKEKEIDDLKSKMNSLEINLMKEISELKEKVNILELNFDILNNKAMDYDTLLKKINDLESNQKKDKMVSEEKNYYKISKLGFINLRLTCYFGCGLKLLEFQMYDNIKNMDSNDKLVKLLLKAYETKSEYDTKDLFNYCQKIFNIKEWGDSIDFCLKLQNKIFNESGNMFFSMKKCCENAIDYENIRRNFINIDQNGQLSHLIINYLNSIQCKNCKNIILPKHLNIQASNKYKYKVDKIFKLKNVTYKLNSFIISTGYHADSYVLIDDEWHKFYNEKVSVKDLGSKPFLENINNFIGFSYSTDEDDKNERIFDYEEIMESKNIKNIDFFEETIFDDNFIALD
jgi:hypothetical protein